ncbi:putative ATP/GTP binding protein [Streptomyces himastatinicus ATCC 53653]|uniref:Putative ATP/GTP binding protein n=1 Tax=Streptomyces himastatinicus ATCC 53653 TaxID=457427 RepID=D9WH40_9ACTN|nr:putative ATP/GTP binding protein [Streptomyces himastatinicus ATCC 53653]
MAVTGYRGPAPGTGRDPLLSAHVSHTGDGNAATGGFVNTGYIGALTMQQRGPQEPADWPHQVGVIPPAARSFLHRAEADRLRARVDGGGTAVLTQLLTGMGGVGKTQLAADYARTAWDDAGEMGGLDVLVWVTASARSPIVTGYAQAGVELCRADPNDPERAARTFLAWLAPKAGAKPCRWLIVLDDVIDPADLHDLWPPASPHGRTLVTTRRRDAALDPDGRHTITIGLFTKDEALTYLTTSLTGRDEPTDELTALAEDLGHLPLALAQATAYLIDTGESVAAYRRLLADRTTTLGAIAPGALPDNQVLPLDAAWSLSIDRADTLRPAGLARPMLQLAAMLDPNGIPHTVLTSEPVLTYLTAHRTRAGEGPVGEQAPVSARDAVHALRALHRLSLIDHTPDTAHQAVRVHQLIQRATRDALTPHQHDQLARTAADALVAAWPDIERDTELAQTLRANTTALTGHAEDAMYPSDGVHGVLIYAGYSLGHAGQVAAAIEYFHRMADVAHGRLGPDHPVTLTIRGELFRFRGEAGDAAGAVTAFAELLEDVVRVLGDDHAYTLATRHHLARSRGETGDAAGAVTAFAELLKDVVRVLGDDHAYTLATRHNLARFRGEMGDTAGAATAHAELLEHKVRVLGPDHPDTLTARGELARVRGQAGDRAGAAAAFADLLEDMVRVLGPDHPVTLSTRGNVLHFRSEAGDAAGAAAAYAELLEDMVRVLGPDHPDTLTTRHNLAYWRGEAGDAAGAAAAYAEVLADRVRVLGDDHPSTLTTRGNIAYWRGEAGDAAGAAAAFAELLTDRVRVQGDDHPDTLDTRRYVARWRGRAGDAAGAVTAYAELLKHIVPVLGDDHLDTLTTRGNLAYWLAEAGDAAGAAAAFAELLTHRVRVQGDDDPKTLTTRHNLAHCRGRAGDAAGAAAAFAELLSDRVRVQGDDHPDTLDTWRYVAYWRGRAGDAAGAAAAYAEMLKHIVSGAGR